MRGRYLLSTAMHDPDRRCDQEEPYDRDTGVVLCALGAAGRHREAEGAVEVGGRWYLLHRRHLTPAALAAELGRAGFRVLRQGGALGGDVVCALEADGSGGRRRANSRFARTRWAPG